MRFNDKELAALGETTPALEGVLHHMKPQGNDWSDWYQQPSFKERNFKVISNLLFYYRVNEPEPLGVIVLENAQIAYERPYGGIPFAFSITFKTNDRLREDGKHIFSCRSQDDVNRWVNCLKTHSYEYWRTQFTILKLKISMRTGKDPVLDYLRNKTNKEQIDEKPKKSSKKPTFHSHIENLTIWDDTNGDNRNGDGSNGDSRNWDGTLAISHNGDSSNGEVFTSYVERRKVETANLIDL